MIRAEEVLARVFAGVCIVEGRMGLELFRRGLEVLERRRTAAMGMGALRLDRG
jgi:hypothetical protein